jgi:hypothetical protein
MSHPSRTKTQGGDRFSRNRPFTAQGRNLWAGWSDSSAQKLLARSWTGPENFKILSFHQKLFNFLIRTDTQIHRHMNLHPYTGGWNFLMPVFDTFHFTTFVKDYVNCQYFLWNGVFYCWSTFINHLKFVHYVWSMWWRMNIGTFETPNVSWLHFV